MEMQKKATITAGMPNFKHTEVEILYATGLDIDSKVLDKIMLLPRKTLVEDLEKVLLDSINRYDLFVEAEKKEVLTEEDITFPIHALIILAEIRSTKSLPLVLQVLRQDTEFLNFWFGEYINMFLWEPLYQLGYSQLNKLKSFICEENINPSVKYAISTAVSQISFHQPEKYLEVVMWYKDIFNFMIQNRDNDKVCNSDVLGFFILDATNIGAIELNNQIKQLFKLEMANEWICGNLDATLEKITEGADNSESLEIRDIFHQYEEIIDFFTKNSSENEEEDELYRFSKN